MAFYDDFNNPGASQNLGDRAGWVNVDGNVNDAYITGGQTTLTSNPASESSFKCTSQGTADHYSQATWLGNCSGFVAVRLTDANNFIGFRNTGSAWQVYKRVAGAFTQLGSDYAVAGSGGDVAKLSVLGNAIVFTVNGTQRCGSPFTDSFNNTEVSQGVISRVLGAAPWLDDFTADTSAGPPPPPSYALADELYF